VKEISLLELSPPEKRAVWNRLQLEYPDIAQFLRDTRDGEFESIVVRFEDKPCGP
jgi:Mrp family chromosome partitioning ATPase